MKKINLSELPLSELIRIQKEIPKIIIKAQRNEKKTLRKKIEALAAESGFNIEEIMGKKVQKKRSKVKPKYENPDNTDQRWTGRGRKPLWVNDHLSEGGTLDDLLI